MRKKKAESRITDDIKAREMHKKHNGPDGEHNANSSFGEATLHQIECAAIVPRPRWYC